MKNSKLIELLKALSKEELLEFQEFVASPYFNKNDDLVKLVNYLSEAGPDYPIDKIKKEYVFGLLFPNIPFDKKRMSYLMNYLLKLGERFLAIRQIEQKDSLLQTYTLEEFANRKLDKHFNFLNKRLDHQVNTKDKRSEGYFLVQFRLSEINTEYIHKKVIRKEDNTLGKLSEDLDNFYFFFKLKFGCEMLNRQSIVKGEYDLELSNQVQAYLVKNQPTHPLIRFYLEIYMLYSSEEDSHFHNISELLGIHDQEIEREELRNIYLYVFNYCVRRLRVNPIFINRALQISKDGIDRGVLLEDDGYLRPWTYSNVVKLAIMSDDTSWLEEFIHDKKELINPQFRKDALHYNLAELYYHKKEYNRVLEQINQVQFSDMQYKMGSRIIQIKTFYELDESETLDSLIASFIQLLRRSTQVSTRVKKSYLNFCTILSKILRYDDRKREAIKQEINKTTLITEKNWLLKVLAENKVI